LLSQSLSNPVAVHAQLLSLQDNPNALSSSLHLLKSSQNLEMQFFAAQTVLHHCHKLSSGDFAAELYSSIRQLIPHITERLIRGKLAQALAWLLSSFESLRSKTLFLTLSCYPPIVLSPILKELADIQASQDTLSRTQQSMRQLMSEAASAIIAQIVSSEIEWDLVSSWLIIKSFRDGILPIFDLALSNVSLPFLQVFLSYLEFAPEPSNELVALSQKLCHSFASALNEENFELICMISSLYGEIIASHCFTSNNTYLQFMTELTVYEHSKSLLPHTIQFWDTLYEEAERSEKLPFLKNAFSILLQRLFHGKLRKQHGPLIELLSKLLQQEINEFFQNGFLDAFTSLFLLQHTNCTSELAMSLLQSMNIGISLKSKFCQVITKYSSSMNTEFLLSMLPQLVAMVPHQCALDALTAIVDNEDPQIAEALYVHIHNLDSISLLCRIATNLKDIKTKEHLQQTILNSIYRNPDDIQAISQLSSFAESQTLTCADQLAAILSRLASRISPTTETVQISHCVLDLL